MTEFFLGIDISKAKFDVALIGEDQHFRATFPNSLAGFKRLFRWLRKRQAQSVWACLEATGRYGDQLAMFLHEQDFRVSMVNPARIRKYADSKLLRNKTDREDANVIADFCRTQVPRLWAPPPVEQRQLQALSRRLRTLIGARTREKNRLKSGTQASCIIISIRSHAAYLDSAIEDIERQIEALIKSHPLLRHRSELLTSIPGIGTKTAARLLGELPDISRFDSSKQVVAYAGLCPSRHVSGSSVRKRTRLSKTGNKWLKSALFLPALSAARSNAIIRQLVERLRKRGKTKMAIVGAAMRKLLQLAYGVLKSGQPFDPNYGNHTVNIPGTG